MAKELWPGQPLRKGPMYWDPHWEHIARDMHREIGGLC